MAAPAPDSYGLSAPFARLVTTGHTGRSGGKGGRSKHRKRRGGKPKSKPGKTPKGKKESKKGAAVKWDLRANPRFVEPVPPRGCSTLTVETFTEVPAGGGHTRRIPFHPGSSTHPVLFRTTFGVLNPAHTTLDGDGTATAYLCSAVAGLATVTVEIPSLLPRELAKRCKPTRGKPCTKRSLPPPVTAKVEFRRRHNEHEEAPPGPGSTPGGVTDGSCATEPETINAKFTFAPNEPPAAPKPYTTVFFDGSGSSDPEGAITGWSWFFGPALHGAGRANTVSGGNGPKPSTSFSAPGVYTVSLTVTGSNCKKGTAAHYVYVSGAGEKSSEAFSQPCPGANESIEVYIDIFIPSYAQNPKLVTSFPVICPGATQSAPAITRITGNTEGRLDDWGKLRDRFRVVIKMQSGAGGSATVPAATVRWE